MTFIINFLKRLLKKVNKILKEVVNYDVYKGEKYFIKLSDFSKKMKFMKIFVKKLTKNKSNKIKP